MNADIADPQRRAPRIKAEDVFAAADTLVMEGHRPTIDRVRMTLGRGSPNTINEHLDQWWQQLGERLQPTPPGTLPGIPDDVTDALRTLWGRALQEAHQALRRSLDDREQGLIQRETALTAREAELTQEEARQATARAAQTDALALAHSQLDQANARARAGDELVRTRDAERAQLQRRLTQQDSEGQALRQELRETMAAGERERQHLNDRYDALQSRSAAEIDRLRQQIKDDQRQLKATAGQLDEVQQQLRQSEIANQRMTAELQAAERVRIELADQTEKHAIALRERDQARNEVTSLTNEVQRLKHEATKRLAQAEAERAEFRERIRSQEHRITQLIEGRSTLDQRYETLLATLTSQRSAR